MNDEFLRRLRKEPRPEFAARLQARLRRQAMSPPAPKVPSRARTLLILLLLGSTAFALTSLAMRGLPPSLLEFYQHAAARIAAGRTSSSAHHIANERTVEGLRWGGSGYNPGHGTALQGATRSAAQTMSAQSAAPSSAGAPAGAAPAGGAPSRPGVPQISVVASWSAYPYVSAMVNYMHASRGTAGIFISFYIDVSLRDSDSWPGPMCAGGSQAPDLAFAFERGSSVLTIPCLRDRSSKAAPVKAVPVAYEGAVLARSPLYGELDLTRRQVFLALAKWIPDPSRPETLRENGNKSWRQIDASLGAEPIEFMGPPLSSPAGHSMIELLMEAGCDTYPWIAALESTHPDRYARICRTVRTDGVYAEVSGLSPPNLLAEPNALGIFGIGRLTNPPLAGLTLSKLDGVEPTPQALASGAYPGSRALYIYTRGRVSRAVLGQLLGSAWAMYSDWALVPPAAPDFSATLDAMQVY